MSLKDYCVFSTGLVLTNVERPIFPLTIVTLNGKENKIVKRENEDDKICFILSLVQNARSVYVKVFSVDMQKLMVNAIHMYKFDH